MDLQCGTILYVKKSNQLFGGVWMCSTVLDSVYGNSLQAYHMGYFENIYDKNGG